LLVELLSQGSTINAGVYCNTIKKLGRAIQNKRCGMLSWGGVMIHGSARTHTLLPQHKISSRHLAGNNSIIPLQPRLSAKWFSCVPASNNFLGGRWFLDEEVKEAVNTWLALQVASFYDAGIQKLVPRYNKCLNNGGNYVRR
jgi:hypothetical protein